MLPNPGGQVDPKDVIGRDELIERIWERLEVQSLALTAERRVGKTSNLRKMAHEPRGRWLPFFQDLEQVGTAHDFAIEVYRGVEQLLGRWTKLAHRTHGLFKTLGGTEIGGVTLPEVGKRSWKALLEHVVDDLLEHQAPHRVVFFWDEFPWMIEKIRDNEGESTARDVLDLLRSLRQTRKDFRVIFTGSVGLHHILGDLKKSGYGNEPVNDMGTPIEVPPLTRVHAEDLASRLIEGAKITTSDRAGVVAAVAQQTGGVPYYIHALIDALRDVDQPNAGDVSRTVRSMLIRDTNPWDMLHYQERIPRYFGDDTTHVLRVLDSLACRNDASTAEVLHELGQQGPLPTSEALCALLRLLVLDHYLEKTDDQRYRFRFALVKRWWGLYRELPGVV